MSKRFKKYTAAVEQARIMSKGSGEINELDHVAKDLHETGFGKKLENLSPFEIKKSWIAHRDEVIYLAKTQYGL